MPVSCSYANRQSWRFVSPSHETISQCDLIACEDTRVSGKLLHHLQITKPLVSYREENEKTKCVEIAEQIESGQNIALISVVTHVLVTQVSFSPRVSQKKP